ncbi:HU family DNA-binding protein [Megalodesulfovibrio gigas]|uniref:Putative histone family protein DNA-binding protein n=1 Tax=Megalodesulfovibrio gigas (strain ATCC 19364 / DSM 1382 / NCIMB 9332 / VKM B-1759) TaxID=1121448 RepID=T2GA69_MEGG1|nr:HU family DNA-binding protein [Megalodesulfovibrio gigas]AGW12812.1 putative histone family protein DNA-binding protein [Megalodesulfovibrio gigas DSM 1382 = ATCC 19364]
MTKAELIDAIALSTGDLNKAAIGQVLDTLAKVAGEALARGEDVPLPGIGKLEVRERAARTGRNPKTGEALEIAAHKAVGFKPSGTLKGAVNA